MTLGAAVAAPLLMLFMMHAALLAASTTLHLVARKYAPTAFRKAYHSVTALVGVVTFALVIFAIWWTFPTRYVIAVAVAVTTYSFVWCVPAIITILERQRVTTDEVLGIIEAVKAEVGPQC